MSSLLTLDRISKRFGYRSILDQVSFTVETGESILLIGNNGAGKSTLLRIINSLMKPTSGSLLFRDKNLTDNLQDWLGIMGSMAHESRLYGDLTSFENLKLFGKLYGVDQLEDKIEQTLIEIDLAHVGQLPVRNFSSGMTKRLMIGRMLICEPEILILDEPYTGLDQLSVKWFQNYLQTFNQKGGTIMMVTHQLALGLELANRVLVLHKNKISHDLPAEGLTVAQCSEYLDE